MGLEPLVTGNITYNGDVICDAGTPHHKRISTDRIAAKGIALVPEGRRVFADMSFNLSKPSNSPLSLSNYGLFVRLDYTLSYLDTNSYPGGYYYSTITFVASSS